MAEGRMRLVFGFDVSKRHPNNVFGVHATRQGSVAAVKKRGNANNSAGKSVKLMSSVQATVIAAPMPMLRSNTTGTNKSWRKQQTKITPDTMIVYSIACMS